MCADSIDINTELTPRTNYGEGKENLHFDDQTCYFLFFVAKISKTNKKHVLYVSVELEKHS